MTRKEEILKAARDYVNGVTLSSPLDVIHFKNGAKWADEHPNLESLWHEASEKPRAKEWLLIQFGEDDYDTIYMYIDIWCDLCKEFGAIRWAYISDLLPKGGEEKKN